MNWNHLTSVEEVNKLDEESQHHPLLIYKHSTRCSICTAAIARIERKFTESDAGKLKPFYIDVLKSRDVSNLIAEKYGVEHQSPQALVIHKGKCVMVLNHMEINYDDLIAAA